MRVAILHFHLRPGGVTRVIELAVEALQSSGLEVLVIVGEPCPVGCRVPAEQITVVPELAYGVGSEKAAALRNGVEAACLAHWGALPDVWHTHNHSLGKNFALPVVVSAWAEAGHALLLQVHDFAENGRPANYRGLRENLGVLSRVLYPSAPRIAYALLNTGDGNRLAAAGLPAGWGVLANPISLIRTAEPCPASAFGAERALVYPTRAIRRKNIGEALLWAALSEDGEVVVLTAAPQSGPDVAGHEAWREFSTRLELPVFFDAQTACGRPVNDFIAGADRCLTTSVAEGFGMAFLEPWMADRPVVGRNLPGITCDFAAAGVALHGLYDRMDFPAEWLERRAVVEMVTEAVKLSCIGYEIPYAENHLQAALSSLQAGDFLDFGRLDEELQREVLLGVRSGRYARDEIRPSALTKDTRHVGGNHAAIAANYSQAAYGEKLALLYECVAGAPFSKPFWLDASVVLRQFLRFDDFSALRV